MELEEMKNMWQKIDQSMQESRILNEQVLKRMLQEKSKTALQRIATMEYLSVFTCAILLLVFGLQWWNLGNDGGLMICYILSMAFIVVAFAASVYKLQFLSTMKPGVDTVTTLQQKTEKFRLFIAREKVVSLVLMPVMLYVIYAVVNYWVEGVNILEHTDRFLFRIILAIGTGIAGGLVVYRKIYFNSIQEIKEHLQEIKEFKNA